jgi:hypothetical protein
MVVEDHWGVTAQVTTGGLTELNYDALDLGIGVQHLGAVFASEARLPEATERQRAGTLLAGAIDPYCADVDSVSGLMSGGEIRRPHRSGETVDRVVGETDHVIEIVEGHQHSYGTKDLFPSDC